MINRPLALKGNIIIRNNDNYIIGKIIKNQNIENDPSNYIQVLDNKNMDIAIKLSEKYNCAIVKGNEVKLKKKKGFSPQKVTKIITNNILN